MTQGSNLISRVRFLLALGLSFPFACSDTGAPSHGSESPELATVHEPLSASEQCDSIDANKTYTDTFPSTAFVTSASYNPSGCSKAYLIDLQSYDHSHTAWDIVEYGDAVPTTRTDCERTRVGVYLWRKSSSTTTYLGNEWRWGTWTSAGCRVPSIRLQADFPDISTGTNFRIAASARLYDTAGGSTFATKKIRVLRVNTPVTGLSLLEDPTHPSCLVQAIDFNRPSSTYRGRTVAQYVLRRDGSVVAKMPPESGPLIQIRDRWYNPRGTNGTHRYTVSVETDRGDESPPSAWITAQERCLGPDLIDRIAIIPMKPRSTPASKVVSEARLDDIMNGDGAGTPSMADYFAKVSNGRWTPQIRVHATHNLSETIDFYRDLGRGLTLTETPSWMPQCSNDFSCGCLEGALPDPSCTCEQFNSTTITVKCEYFLNKTREDEVIIENLKRDFPEYREKTLFAFVFMNVPGGGAQFSGKAEFGGDEMLPGQPFAIAGSSFAHEIGHALGLMHSGGYFSSQIKPCDIADELFGDDPFRIGIDCNVHRYADDVDIMASGNHLRPYNQFSRWVLDWIEDANVSVYRPLSDSSKTRTGTLYAEGTGTRDSLIQVQLDEAGSALLIEYRNSAGYFDPDFTGADDDFEPGVYVTFRPGKEVPSLDEIDAQSFGQLLARPIQNGETVKLEDTLGVTLQLSNMTADRVTTKVTWR